MSNTIWLLVECVNSLGPSYDIVSIDPIKCNGQDIRTGKLIYIRTQHDNHPRQVLVRRISDSRKELKNVKKFLEKEETKYNNIVADCVQITKNMKSDKNVNECFSAVSNLQPHNTRSTSKNHMASDDSSSDEEHEKFNQLVQSLAEYSSHFKRSDKPKSYRRSYPGGHHRRRSMISSTPKPGNCRDDIKLTFDQATQTEESGPIEAQNNSANIAIMEELVKRLYKKFTSLISDFERDESHAIQRDSVENSEESSVGRVPTPHRALAAIAEVAETARQSSNESGTEQVISTSNIRTEAGPTRTKMVKVRRVSAHTTNTLDLSRSNDMVLIGNGNVSVPSRLMDKINWASYTSATRQLLQAVFPRRVLATHSLTGKQSPAFLDKPAKKCLDPKLVEDIVMTVTQRCAGVTDRLVRNCITIKCTDEAKLYRNRQQCRYGRLLGQEQENVPPSSNTSEHSDSS